MAQEILNATVTADGGSEESSVIGVSGTDGFTLTLEGDSNAKDFDYIILSNSEEGGDFTEYDRVRNHDLTSYEGGGKSYPFDSSELHDIKVKAVNNHSVDSQTTVTVTR